MVVREEVVTTTTWYPGLLTTSSLVTPAPGCVLAMAPAPTTTAGQRDLIHSHSKRVKKPGKDEPLYLFHIQCLIKVSYISRVNHSDASGVYWWKTVLKTRATVFV